MLMGIQQHHSLVKGNGEIGLELEGFEFSLLARLAGEIVLFNLSDQGFISRADLGDGSDDELGGKLELCLDWIVSEQM